MAELPRGTVTFLFTDVADSTELVKRLGGRYAAALAEHRDLLRAAFAAHEGVEVDTQGDAFFVAFARARAAVEAAVAAGRALAAHPWPEGARLAVRAGLHTGDPHVGADGYTGVAVHRGARICTLGHGGQILLSRATAGIVDDEELAGVSLRDLGEHPLKDFERPERVHQVVADGLPVSFPPLRGAEAQLPLAGTVTVVLVEGRRMMRLATEIPEQFASLVEAYQRLVSDVLARAGGRYVDAGGDAVSAAFASPRDAVRAAAEVHRRLASSAWPHGRPVEASIGVHSGEAGIGWSGPAILRCGTLCDAAEGGETLASPTTASLLEDVDLGGLAVRDAGELRTRRTGETVRAFRLV